LWGDVDQADQEQLRLPMAQHMHAQTHATSVEKEKKTNEPYIFVVDGNPLRTKEREREAARRLEIEKPSAWRTNKDVVDFSLF